LKLYCATGNRGKLREFQLAAAQSNIEIDLAPGFPALPPCVEDGATFDENAAKKALYYWERTGKPGPVFADDSGLAVDALDAAPGVYSARFAGEGATDDANNALLLERLRGVKNRAARFLCSIALVDQGCVLGIYHGSVEGEIRDPPRGCGGFGYDPLFFYPPFGCTFGEASEEQKLSASHRGQAFEKMLRALTPA
jgi:XTP/dITP diphosphohydrolase